MARCLRCMAGNEWIEGDARRAPKDGISIVYALDSDEFARGSWSGESQKSFTLFVSFKSVTTGSIGQHAEDSLN